MFPNPEEALWTPEPGFSSMKRGEKALQCLLYLGSCVLTLPPKPGWGRAALAFRGWFAVVIWRRDRRRARRVSGNHKAI